MKRLYIIDSVEQLRLMSDPLRIEIVSLLIKDEYTGKQLGDLLGIAASKVHYHLKELEQHGIIEVVRTEEKNGIVQKFFRAAAYDFKFDESLLPSLQGDSHITQEIVANMLRMSTRRMYEAPESSFLAFADEKERPPLVHVATEVKASRDDLKAWIAKYHQLLGELDEMEKRFLARVEAGELEDRGEIFYAIMVGFMTEQPVFYHVADDLRPDLQRNEQNIMLVKKKVERTNDDPNPV